VIWESHSWKNQLVADAKTIQRWVSKTQHTQRRCTLIERKVFLAAYAIRKLDDDYKLSTKFHDRSFPCRTYPAKSNAITLLNADKVDDLYQLDCAKSETISVRHLMDIIIHNLVFLELLRDDLTVEAFLVTSDRRKTRLWEIRADAFIKLMHDIGNDYPSTFRYVCNPDTEEFVVWQGHGSPPASFEGRAQQIMKHFRPHG